MEALTACIAFLSKGQPVGTKPNGYAYERFEPHHKPDAHSVQR